MDTYSLFRKLFLVVFEVGTNMKEIDKNLSMCIHAYHTNKRLLIQIKKCVRRERKELNQDNKQANYAMACTPVKMVFLHNV